MKALLAAILALGLVGVTAAQKGEPDTKSKNPKAKTQKSKGTDLKDSKTKSKGTAEKSKQ